MPVGVAALRCPVCREPLEVRGYTHPGIRPGSWPHQTLVERYAEFLPADGYRPSMSLGEGFTPLVDAPELAACLGVARLLLKNETVNPTWSFKDRGTVVALSEALHLGYRAVGVVSTGNMAASVAAYGARAGIPVLVLVGADTPAEKLTGIGVYGPSIVRVHGDYADLYDVSLRLGDGRIRFLNSDSPARVEGSKTIAFEVCEQTGYNPPGWVIVPTSSGGNIRGIAKGLEEMAEAGLIRHVPRLVCAQAAGCAPIYEAWCRGADEIVPVAHPHTIAHAIANPRPPSGNAVLRRLRNNDGVCVAVDDENIVACQLQLATAGLFGQPEGAVPLAAAYALARSGLLHRDDTVMCVVTGSGLKYPRAIESTLPASGECSLDELDAHVASWLKSSDPGRKLP
jgi:threonine synthase